MGYDDDPQVAHLVKGLTRPAMFQGVPMPLVYLEIVLVGIFFVQTGNIFMILLIVPLHALFYVLTIKDENFSNILRVRARRYRPWLDNSSCNP